MGGASELIGGDENRRVILAVLGKSAPVARDAGRHVLRRLYLDRSAERQEAVLLSGFLDDELSPPELFDVRLLDSELFEESEDLDSDFEPPSPEDAAALSFEPESDELPDSALSPLAPLPPLP